MILQVEIGEKNTFILTGNHDISKNKGNSVLPFEFIPNVYVYEEQTPEIEQPKKEAKKKEAKKNQEVAVSIKGAVIGRNLKQGEKLLTFIPKTNFPELEKLSDLLSSEEFELIEIIKKIETQHKKEVFNS